MGFLSNPCKQIEQMVIPASKYLLASAITLEKLRKYIISRFLFDPKEAMTQPIKESLSSLYCQQVEGIGQYPIFSRTPYFFAKKHASVV